MSPWQSEVRFCILAPFLVLSRDSLCLCPFLPATLWAQSQTSYTTFIMRAYIHPRWLTPHVSTCFILLDRACVDGVPHHVQVACVLFNLVGVKVPVIFMHVWGHLLYVVDPLPWNLDLTTHTTAKNEEAGTHKDRSRIRQKRTLTNPFRRERNLEGPVT